MLKIFSKISLLVLIMSSSSIIHAQSFGFGCFGFVGGFGGYSYQTFKPGTLKYYGSELNTPIGLTTDPYFEEFNKASGFRVGLNFFRAKFSGVFLSTKGYYQVLTEKKNINVSGTYPDVEYDLDLKSWGLGVDVGIPITTSLNWKILDGELMFNSARFKRTINQESSTSVERFNNDSPDIGYSIGTGFIVSIVEGYISLEGTAAYTIMKIEKMHDDFGNNFLNNENRENEDFIKSGGFSALIQLNIGFPL